MPSTLSQEAKPLARDDGRVPSTSRESTWVIVLAGGDGTRLQHWTRTAGGIAVPKQFCRFRPERSLLAATLARARRLAKPDHILVLVNQAHRAWWSPELCDLPEDNVLAQPRNRGTAVAILHALVRVLVRDDAPAIVLLPSDHDVEAEGPFTTGIQQAMSEAQRLPDHPVLLGVTPTHPDPGLGWIVAAAARGEASQAVVSFVEKPTLAVASRLMGWGALWNSFVLASSSTALFRLYEDTQPTLLEMYFQGLSYTQGKSDALLRLYRMLPGRDFGTDVLQQLPQRLRVVTAPACGWVDLGTPERVSAWLERHRDSPLWQSIETARPGPAMGPALEHSPGPPIG